MYKEYFLDFIQKLSSAEVRKIQYALDLLKTDEFVPRHYIKYIRDGVYELRVNYGHNEFRIFFIYDWRNNSCIVQRFSEENPEDSRQ